MSNTMGTVFRLTTFGESHGVSIGCVVDGCPAGLALSEADIQPQMDRRRPGQSDITSARSESDRVAILSGVQGGVTLGSPIAIKIDNLDAQPGDYDSLAEVPRPSHADWTYRVKYGVSAKSGGGRASARETAARVAGGAVAGKLLKIRHGVGITAWVSAVGGITAANLEDAPPSPGQVDASPARCPDPAASAAMVSAIREAATAGDSLGGIVTCVAAGVPAGWGEPVFGKAHALLAAAMLSIPAARGFEIGSGFAGTRMRGSEHNDPFESRDGRPAPKTNRAGGVLGGITSGAPIVFRVAFKPVASIRLPQTTVDYDGRPVVLESGGRHDPCVLPRAVPVVEAMAALVLADLSLISACA